MLNSWKQTNLYNVFGNWLLVPQMLHLKYPRYAPIFMEKLCWNLTLFFLPNSVSFNGQDYEKQKGSGTSEQSPFRLQTSSE